MLPEYIKPKYLLIAAGIVIAAIIYATFSYSYILSNPLLISKVPLDAKLSIDGKEVTGDRTHLTNGTHTIKGEKDGFTTYDGVMLVDSTTKYVAVSLSPSSDAAKKWADSNQQLYLDQEKLLGPSGDISSNPLADKYPIINKLPIKTSIYSIGYILDPSDSSGMTIKLTIHAEPGYNNRAIAAIYDAGYDPASYNIVVDSGIDLIKEDSGE